jgi:hypothetical protein
VFSFFGFIGATIPLADENNDITILEVLASKISGKMKFILGAFNVSLLLIYCKYFFSQRFEKRMTVLRGMILLYLWFQDMFQIL